MNIIYDNSLLIDDYNNLRKSAGWIMLPVDQAEAGIKNSEYVAVAKHEGATVGMARVFTDGGCVAYIADVVVLPEYQGLGIGKNLMNMIMTYLDNKLEKGHMLYVSLMAAPGKEDFYKKFEFLERPNEFLGAGMTRWIKK